MRKILILLLLPIWSFAQVSDATIKTNTNTNIRNASTVTRSNHAAINDQLTDAKSSRIQAISLSGTNTYTTNITWLSSYQTGLNFLATFVNGNTSSATLNINSLGAKTLKKFSGGSLADLSSGDISNGQIYQLVYDGTFFQVSIPGSVGGSGTVTSVSVATANGFSGSVANATTTPAITLTLQDATTSQSGQLTSTDWNTFNSKQSALGYTPVNQTRTISTTSPLTGGGDLTADRTFAINQATTSTDGYLSSTDWNTFNGKISSTKAANWRDDLSSTATAAGTTTLTASSNKIQVFTGSTTQTMVLPNATTLTVGHTFIVHNQSTGLVTVNTNGGATIRIIAGGFDAEFVCTSIGTAAGTWEIQANLNTATGKGLTVNNTLTLAGTDATTMTFPSATTTVGGLGTTQTWTGANTFNNASVLAGAATMAVFNTTATNLSFGGAATTLNIGGTPTTAITHNYSANATASATTKTVNIGTAGAAGSTTNVNIGSATASAVLGTLTLGFPTIAQPSNYTSLNLFNTQTTTLNLGGAATTVAIGAATGTATINNVTTAIKHLDGTTSAPSIAAGVGAGTTPTVSLGTNSNDIAGIINITTGTTPTGSNAIVATITFNTAYVTAPFVTLTPANRNAQALTGSTVVLVPAAGQTNGTTTTAFIIESGATALSASTAYIWYYQVIQ